MYSDVKRRHEVCVAMHKIMCNIQDETAYKTWIEEGITDFPTEEDLWGIASDYDDYEAVCGAFIRILNEYGKYGI